jgi:hypothetical protein
MASFYTGNSGRSTGEHLDFRVWDVEKGSYVDPRGFTNVMTVGGKPLTDQFGVTSGYGMRNHPVSGGQKMHHGIDYGTPTGTKVDIAGTYLTTFNDKGGGVTSQYAFTGEDGRKYEALLMHGSDQNSILSDSAITGGMAKPQPKPARVEAKTKAQEFQKMREGNDITTGQATSLADYTPVVPEPPEYGQAKPFDIRDRDVEARGGYDPRFDKK